MHRTSRRCVSNSGDGFVAFSWDPSRIIMNSYPVLVRDNLTVYHSETPSATAVANVRLRIFIHVWQPLVSRRDKRTLIQTAVMALQT